MNIFEHFGSYTLLPIDIDDVAEHAVEISEISRFRYHRVRADSSTLKGISTVYEILGAYGERIANIAYSHQIVDEAEVRLVCCKEILHAIEDESLSASSPEAVSNLIDRISAPLELHPFFNSDASDKVGLLAAVAILLPLESLSILRPMFEAGEKTAEDIASMAKVPLDYVKVALHPQWPQVVEAIILLSVGRKLSDP